jgi:UDP-glucuronate 4-epimerase
MKILVTGAAGFIGSRLVEELAKRGDQVVGIDNINSYYDPRLKIARLNRCGVEFPTDLERIKTVPCAGTCKEEVEYPNIPFYIEYGSDMYQQLRFVRMDIMDRDVLQNLFQRERFDAVMNLAAQAGVRYSIENPYAYIESNIVGFLNLLECARRFSIKHFVYASSSSVYGGNKKTPFSEDDRVDNPVSLYAATKKSDELIAHVYSKLYTIPTTGLRFFTVYGPWGRPDMAPMLFADAIVSGKPIKVFNNGNLSRDFTYIDDIVNGAIQVIDQASSAEIPAEIYNIGCGHPVALMDFIHTLEDAIGKKAIMEMLPMQEGDVYTTYADTTKLKECIGYIPRIALTMGIGNFIKWYSSFFCKA